MSADVEQAAFRHAVGQFASGIVVVTTGSGHAMTVSAFSSVSLDPPLVLFCAEKVARFHDAVLDAGSWAVSILAEDAEKTARWLATRGRPLKGQFDGLPHHRAPVTGAPVLDDALAVLECTTQAVHDAGDHSIVVGRVVAASGPAPASGPAATRVPAPVTGPAPASGPAATRGPLLHYGGRYRRLRPLPPPPPAAARRWTIGAAMATAMDHRRPGRRPGRHPRRAVRPARPRCGPGPSRGPAR